MKSVITMLITVIALNYLQAQDAPVPIYPKETPSFFFEFNVPLAIPQEAFGREMDKNGFGFGLGLMAKPQKLPFKLGINADFIFYDRERIRVEDQIGGFTRKFNLRTRTSSFLTHAVVRFQPNLDFIIQPFIEANIGFHALTTRSRLSDTNNTDSSNNTEASNRDSFDGGLSYGGVVGVTVRLLKKEEVYLNVQCAYYKRSEAEYHVRKDNPIINDNSLDAFELRRSTIDLLMPKIGVSIIIPDCDN